MSNHHAVNGATGDLRGRSTEKAYLLVSMEVRG